MYTRLFTTIGLAATALCLNSLAAGPLAAQDTGTIQGTVTRSDNSAKILGANVSVKGTGLEALTGTDGRFSLQRVPPGEHTLLVRWVGYRPLEVKVTVAAGATATADVSLEAQPIMLSEILVSTASRTPERVVDAPAAVTLVDTRAAQGLALTGQAPLAIASVPGVDVVQSGVNDININTRGFNSSLNRRVLVLQDGRDLAVAFIGAQEWNALSTSMEDLGRMEMVRGPGSALYGANAFSGVLSITTPSAREVVGTKLTVGGGELSTFRGDLRHAGVLSRGQLGYKINGGYSRSDTWSRSRTAIDSLDLRREYTVATDPASVAKTDATGRPYIEVSALNGQAKDAVTGAATGDRLDLVNMYGTGRLDYYANNGAVGTLEGGASRVQNEIFVTGIGRVQILEAFRPWVRANWSHSNYTLMAWYSGRRSPDSTASSPTVNQRVLGSGNRLADVSDLFHAEAQYNRSVMDDKLRVVLGGSFRNYYQDTKGTLMDPAIEPRSDQYYSGYGQVEYRPTPVVRFVAAGRLDDGTLFKPQISPKGAIVISPNSHHSFRATVNQAFQTPSYSEFFLRTAVAAPQAGPAALEAGLEGYFGNVRANAPAAATAAGVPAACVLPPASACLAWDFPAATQALALGNPNLEPEKVLGVEVGYKGDISSKVFVTADLYYNRLTNFVTDLLPGGVNPSYPPFSLSAAANVATILTNLDAALAGAGLPPTHPLRAPIPTLQANYAGLNAQVGTRLSTLPNGQRAIVVSYGNAGKANERGIEFGIGALLTNELRVDGSYTFFDFDIDSTTIATGDKVSPNTPKHKGTLGLSYRGSQGVDVSLTARFVEAYSWVAGVYAGTVPAAQTINASVSYQVNNNLRLNLVATNLLDQQRFQVFGGSVIGRRVLGGITATF